MIDLYELGLGYSLVIDLLLMSSLLIVSRVEGDSIETESNCYFPTTVFRLSLCWPTPRLLPQSL